MTLGKSIGGGVPIGTYGVTKELAERIAAQADADYEDTGGVGGTLAGNALSLAATRATLGEVLTDDAFERMIALRERFVEGVRGGDRRARRAVVDRLSSAPAASTASPRSRRAPARESAAADDPELEEYLHLYLMNRGVLITPFHNMALMCPATTEEQVDRHTEVFGAAVAELAA